MKHTLRSFFQPILSRFESGDEAYRYDKTHRKILIAVGFLFLVLSTVSGVLAVSSAQLGGAVPFVAFLLLGLVCEVVGFLGDDRAVAKIWGSK